MYVMVFPRDYTINRPSPIPVEAKRFGDRLAMFWLLFPKGKRVPASVSVNWSFVPLAQDLDIEVDTINRQIFLASKRDRATDYDIALSFAGEDRPYVQQVADELTRQGVRVFYDEFEQDKLWGTNLYQF
jgi:hypothetical protein